MKNELGKEFSQELFDQSIGLREALETYLKHYKWFIFSVLLLLVVSFFHIRRQVPQYNVHGVILIKEKEKGSSIDDLSKFQDLGLFSSSSNSLENEIQLLKSRRLMTKVVEELKLNIRYFIEDSPYNKEYYPNAPINIIFVDDSLAEKNSFLNFNIIVRSKESFEFFNNENESQGVKRFGIDFIADFGTEEISNRKNLRIDLNSSFHGNVVGEKIIVQYTPVNLIADSYRARLQVRPVNERSSKVITLSLDETIIVRGVSFINNLIEQYNADGIDDKNEIAQTTIDFLDLRIGLMSTELAAIEGTAEQFKTRNRMIDANAGADIFLQSSSTNESQLVAANTQNELTNYMLEELNRSEKGQLLPSNIGLDDVSILNMINEYNNLVLQRNRILKSSSEINPIILNIDSQLEVLKNNLISSFRTLSSSLEIQINALINQSSKINSRIASVPKNEREFKDIVRQQETKNALYLFLLQKREESILANAVRVQKAKVIDEAYSSGGRISPNPSSTYIGAIFFGLTIPFVVIFIANLLDTKIHSEKDLSTLDIPYLGDIPLESLKQQRLVTEANDSKIAEAFRYIRTNLSFMFNDAKGGKMVFITSTQSHEGKTFAAINLASSLAMSEKRTILIAMDLRAPRISKYLEIKKEKVGVTNFVKNKNYNFNDIIKPFGKVPSLDIIESGDIPPNPVELLMSNRISEIFEYCRENYDYVIVDTAPVGMVTDTIQISNHADLTIYIIKANHLDKRLLHIPEKLHREKRLRNMAIVINGTNHNKGAYGYGYGYGNDQKQNWFKNLFR